MRSRSRALFTSLLILTLVISGFSLWPAYPAESAVGDYLWGSPDPRISDQFHGDIRRLQMEPSTDNATFYKYSHNPYREWVIRKINNADGALLWQVAVNADMNWDTDIVADRDGGFYVSGLCDDFNAGCVHATNGMFVRHYDAGGTMLWENRYPKPTGIIWGQDRFRGLQRTGKDVIFTNYEVDSGTNRWRIRRLASLNGAEQWPSPTNPSNCGTAEAQTGFTVNGHFIFSCVESTASDRLWVRVYNPADNNSPVTYGEVTGPGDTLQPDIFGTADGGIISIYGTLDIVKLTPDPNPVNWDIAWSVLGAGRKYVMNPNGQNLYVGKDNNPGGALNVHSYNTGTGGIEWTTTLDIAPLQSIVTSMTLDGGGMHVVYRDPPADNAFYTKLDADGNFLIGSQDNNIPLPAGLPDSDNVTSWGDAAQGVPDGQGGAVFGWIDDHGDGNERLWGSRIEGVAIPAVPNTWPCPADALSPGTAGKTVDIYSNDVSYYAVLYGGTWGWKLQSLNDSPGIVAASGEATNSVRLLENDYIVVGGPGGWRVLTFGGSEVFSSTLPVYVVDGVLTGLHFFAGGPYGWEVRNISGTILQSGSDVVFDGAIERYESKTTVTFGGPWGWKRIVVDTGAVLAQGSDPILSIQDDDQDEFASPTLNGAYTVAGGDGYFFHSDNGDRTGTFAARSVASPVYTGDVQRALLGGDGGLVRVRDSDGTEVTLTPNQIIALDHMDLVDLTNSYGIYGGIDGWGVFDPYDDTHENGGPEEVWAVRVDTDSRSAVIGGPWGWAWTWTVGGGAYFVTGTDPVNVCLVAPAPPPAGGGPLPPGPPPPPPDEAFSNSKRLSVYDGIVWIVGGAPDYDAMKLGEAGRDITSSGRLYFMGNSTTEVGAASFEGQPDIQGQRLSLNAGGAPFPALQLHAQNSPALEVTQHNAGGLAARFLGNVYVSGEVRAVNGGTKSSVVPVPSGERKLYAVESPDARFSDYGEAQLTNGAVRVALDPIFAETINTDSYHIALTAKDNPTVLSVSQQDASGFTVSGEQDVAFFYEIVGIRKGFEEKGEE